MHKLTKYFKSTTEIINGCFSIDIYATEQITECLHMHFIGNPDNTKYKCFKRRLAIMSVSLE